MSKAKDRVQREKDLTREYAVSELALLYHGVLHRNRNRLAGQLTESEAVQLARLRASYMSTFEPVDLEGCNPEEMFQNPIPVSKDEFD